MKKNIRIICALAPMLALVTSTPVFSQSQSQSQPSAEGSISISYLIGFTSVISGAVNDGTETASKGEEGSVLQAGDIIRTGDDSAVRIVFPNGTAETLCANSTYVVVEKGSEELEQGEDNNTQAMTAFSECNLRPSRNLAKRCFFGGSTNTLDFSKPGSRRYADTTKENENNSLLGRAGQGDSCTLGEELYARFNIRSEPEPIPQPIPEPVKEPVTVPAAGGSPI